MRLKFKITEVSSFRSVLFVICIVALVSGCNQRRYKPSTWRPAVAQNTLPTNEETASTKTRWSTLPSPFDQTLPYRGGSTLPNRGGMWTLPNRGGSTLPNRGGMWTLPNRGGSTLPNRGWSTLPRRGGLVLPDRQGVTNLPARYPEYDQVPRTWNTLPQRSPIRGSTTLPFRINPLR